MMEKPGKQWLKFTAIGLGYALMVELAYKFGLKFNPKGFFVSIPFYVLILQADYLLHRWADRHAARGSRADYVYFFACGFLGLVLFEWMLVGFTPAKTPFYQQILMFLFHASYPMLARLYVDAGETAGIYRRRINRYYAIAVAIGLLGVLAPTPDFRKLWFLFYPSAVYAGLCFWGIAYIRAKYYRN